MIVLSKYVLPRFMFQLMKDLMRAKMYRTFTKHSRICHHLCLKVWVHTKAQNLAGSWSLWVAVSETSWKTCAQKPARPAAQRVNNLLNIHNRADFRKHPVPSTRQQTCVWIPMDLRLTCMETFASDTPILKSSLRFFWGQGLRVRAYRDVRTLGHHTASMTHNITSWIYFYCI